MNIRKCKSCGFILGTRPNSGEKDGECLACYNKSKKENINWEERQQWLTKFIKEKRNDASEYDCVVGVSGGKDSITIVKRLFEKHEVSKALLVHVCDEFTKSKAGQHNLDLLVKSFNVDLMDFRFSPQEFIENTRSDFINHLIPLKWIEEKIYSKPLEIAKTFNIPLVFMGENYKFEYGESEDCEIFHPSSDENTSVIFMGSIWPYSNTDSLIEAKKLGFKTLDDFDDWFRQGSADSFTQIDSVGYMIHHWTKFIKFGFQRVSDLACRFVRENVLTKEQAEQKIKDFDWICDPYAKKDFCRTINISVKEFDEVIDKFANTDLLVKDSNGNWRRKDLF